MLSLGQCESSAIRNSIPRTLKPLLLLKRRYVRVGVLASPRTLQLPRYRLLYNALVSNKIEIRVLPDSALGLIHGKAGVIRRQDGSATAFLGSVNENATAWKVNYELPGV